MSDYSCCSHLSVAELPSETSLLARLRHRQDLRASMLEEQESGSHSCSNLQRSIIPKSYSRTTGLDSSSPGSLLTKLRRLQDSRASIVEQEQDGVEPFNVTSQVATSKNYSRSSKIGDELPHSLLTKLRRRQEQRASMTEEIEKPPQSNHSRRSQLVPRKSYFCDRNVVDNLQSPLLGRLRHRQELRASKVVQSWETQYNLNTSYSAAAGDWDYEKSIFSNTPPPVPSHGISDAWFGLPYAQMYISRSGVDGYFTSHTRRAGRAQFPTLEITGVSISDLLCILGKTADDRHATNASSVFGGNPVQRYNQRLGQQEQRPKSSENPRPRSPYLFSVDDEPPSTATIAADHSQVVSPDDSLVEQCRIVHVSSVAELRPDKPHLVSVDCVGNSYSIKPSFA
ncbi:hypothetical protein COEREDRAFT_11489 [Coemansia reversa NRRL 1564]|uniref:Uncharacterized protein n=1 Tax=Coemansia reversa (strain ATCC 12441 / NRRL 1564) TaxID=763665 RepID=A0A2G5B308_COERN|nr:hypothetical protein COEREDRAFT_11489 [Coemansia reversa NRRL 1564]|eukprot:PIA13403.1 hypothetical protein COEREDRAFT_11489 [Coemansia reversa NRRL 1564]